MKFMSKFDRKYINKICEIVKGNIEIKTGLQIRNLKSLAIS